jgi:hypothetical protein
VQFSSLLFCAKTGRSAVCPGKISLTGARYGRKLKEFTQGKKDGPFFTGKNEISG